MQKYPFSSLAHVLSWMIAAISFGFTSLVQAAPPNVVMILSDDQAWSDYSFMGHPHIRTPHLDRLASRSLVFTRGYVPDSLCRPSLASIISGMYPHQHGIVGNDPPVPEGAKKAAAGARYRHPAYVKVREQYLDHIRRVDTICDRLAPLGYRSLQTGKWWEGNWSTGGFTSGMTVGDFSKNGRHGDVGLEIGRKTMEPIPAFLDQAKSDGKPFFLWYAPMLPHTPHDPPARLVEHYRKVAPTPAIADYWAMCEFFDESIGQLMNLLDERGLSENTMVMYVTDNGWINDPQAAKYMPRSKRSQYEGGVRTPIMVCWPGKLAPRRDETHLASSIDLVPTALAACGIPADSALPGINLMDEKAVHARHEVYGEIFEHDIVSMNEPRDSLMWRWMIRDQWKLIVPHRERRPNDPVELFDVLADPAEKNNLAEQHPELVKSLSQALDQWYPAK